MILSALAAKILTIVEDVIGQFSNTILRAKAKCSFINISILNMVKSNSSGAKRNFTKAFCLFFGQEQRIKPLVKVNVSLHDFAGTRILICCTFSKACSNNIVDNIIEARRTKHVIIHKDKVFFRTELLVNGFNSILNIDVGDEFRLQCLNGTKTALVAASFSCT